jgi:F-type H+-transporting ATPase subunit delta
MSEITVATRYAKSLIDLAQEQNALEEIRQDMVFFVNTLRASSELQAVLRNPIIAHIKKIKILEAIFGSKVNKTTEAFFRIMINKSRGEILYPTAKEFINQYDILKHITKAVVVSATPLSAENKRVIESELLARMGGSIALQTKVDPALIGGFVLTVGDLQIDTSISNSLARLKQDFAQRIVQ